MKTKRKAGKLANLGTRSLHPIDLLVRPPRDGHGHAQDVHHDPVGGRLRPPPLAHAGPGRRLGVRRHRRRGRHRAPGEAG